MKTTTITGEACLERSRIVVIAGILAALGAILPMLAAYYLSWSIAVRNEQAQLARLADSAVMRADSALKEATRALKTANRFGMPACAEAHVSAMRSLVVNTAAIEDIGYFENGLLRCTSWGAPPRHLVRSPPADFTTDNGIEVIARTYPTISTGIAMTAFRDRSYTALTNPVRFVDVIAEPGTRIAVATRTGIVVSTLNEPHASLTARLADLPKTGKDAEDLFATSRGSNWIAVASAPSIAILNDMDRERLLLLPAGALIAALMVGLVVWLSRRRLSPLGELSIAVQRREFVVHYQPLIELKSGICVGAEALVRWRRPDGQMVRPDLFIPLAEENGLIEEITDQVIYAMIAELRTILLADRSLHIAVNLAADDIKSGRILPMMDTALKSTGILPQQIWLEATERGFMDVKSARATIEEARRRGHSVAIDDFGTGYSSLQYLQELPLDALKIDKSFIDTIGTDSATSSITPHIIDIAKSLDLHVVAEGIERQEQADYLIERGVQYGQGWLFSKALPAAEFIAFYNNSKRQRGAGPAVIRREIA